MQITHIELTKFLMFNKWATNKKLPFIIANFPIIGNISLTLLEIIRYDLVLYTWKKLEKVWTVKYRRETGRNWETKVVPVFKQTNYLKEIQWLVYTEEQGMQKSIPVNILWHTVKVATWELHGIKQTLQAKSIITVHM